MKIIWIWIWRLQLKKLIWFCLHFPWWRKKIFWICTIICGLVKCIFEFFYRICVKKSDISWLIFYFSESIFFLTVFILCIYLLLVTVSFRKWLYSTRYTCEVHVSNLTLISFFIIVQFCASPIYSQGSVTYVSKSCEYLWCHITK